LTISEIGFSSSTTRIFFAIIGPPWFKIHYYSITVLGKEREGPSLKPKHKRP
jgi:hypothetical protein